MMRRLHLAALISLASAASAFAQRQGSVPRAIASWSLTGKSASERAMNRRSANCSKSSENAVSTVGTPAALCSYSFTGSHPQSWLLIRVHLPQGLDAEAANTAGLRR